ncbi:MAG: hypothetical protein RMJ45_01900 [Candidatus Calescibacterium sp.]|nr:hypothetical protein [Candidatus Calescibacterium sp.]
MEILIYIILNFGLSWEYKSSRALALGGVGVALKDPQTSFFLNPAAMRGTKSLDIISLEIQISESIISSVSKVSLLSDIFSGEDFTISDIKDFLGKGYGANIYYFPHFIVSVNNVSFGLGILSGLGIGLKPSVSSNITLTDTFFLTGALPVLGGAFSIVDNSVEIGVSLVPFEAAAISRFELRENEVLSFQKIFPAFSKEPGDILNDIIESNCTYPLDCAFGFGGFNLGVIWNPVWVKGFSVGIDARDIADPIRKTTADFGISYMGKLYNVRYSLFLDFQDFIFTQSGRSDIATHIFFGSELNFGIPSIQRFISVMLGVGQMNLSAGLELNLKVISFTIGTFAQELRSYIGASSIRYYFFKLAI